MGSNREDNIAYAAEQIRKAATELEPGETTDFFMGSEYHGSIERVNERDGMFYYGNGDSGVRFNLGASERDPKLAQHLAQGLPATTDRYRWRPTEGEVTKPGDSR